MGVGSSLSGGGADWAQALGRGEAGRGLVGREGSLAVQAKWDRGCRSRRPGEVSGRQGPDIQRPQGWPPAPQPGISEHGEAILHHFKTPKSGIMGARGDSIESAPPARGSHHPLYGSHEAVQGHGAGNGGLGLTPPLPASSSITTLEKGRAGGGTWAPYFLSGLGLACKPPLLPLYPGGWGAVQQCRGLRLEHGEPAGLHPHPRLAAKLCQLLTVSEPWPPRRRMEVITATSQGSPGSP